MTEPEKVARIVRDVARRIPSSIQVASDFMSDPRGEEQAMKWDVRILDAVPVDAAEAAMYRVTERFRILQVDGKETFEGDVNSFFNPEDLGLGRTGGLVEPEAFFPEGRLAVIRIIREELAYAGVVSARISSRVIENE